MWMTYIRGTQHTVYGTKQIKRLYEVNYGEAFECVTAMIDRNGIVRESDVGLGDYSAREEG